MASILFIGDIVGKPGREAVNKVLPGLIARRNPDLVIANGENAAGGAGITEKVLDELTEAGIDLVTGGNHIWDRKEIFQFIDSSEQLLRPANYPEGTPGRGSIVIERNGIRYCIANILGRVFMRPIDCPFSCANKICTAQGKDADITIIDFHTEATSEKQALAWHLNGRVGAVIGTHTHVQTADERILPGGTAYISDVGMAGQYNSILGVDPEGPLKRFLTQLPAELSITGGRKLFNAVFIDFEVRTGKALSIERINSIIK